MSNAIPSEIKSFLEKIRRTLPNDFILRHSKKNKKTITELGFNKRLVIEEIDSLSAENYSAGPVSEIGTSNKVWIFGKIINNREIYIKLKMIGKNNQGEERETTYCMSFHFAEQCLDYPNKKQTGE